jgi:hypothetical protein
VCRGFEVEAAAAVRHDRDAGEDLRLTDGSGEQQFRGLSGYKRRHLRRRVWGHHGGQDVGVEDEHQSKQGGSRAGSRRGSSRLTPPSGAKRAWMRS